MKVSGISRWYGSEQHTVGLLIPSFVLISIDMVYYVVLLLKIYYI